MPSILSMTFCRSHDHSFYFNDLAESVYKTWCRGERKERYFREGDAGNGVFSYDALDTEDFNGCDLFSESLFSFCFPVSLVTLQYLSVESNVCSIFFFNFFKIFLCRY